MGFLLLPQSTREFWEEWELRLLVLLSLVLQLTLASQGSRRKSIARNWIQFVVWTTYLMADSIATITLGILSNHLANIKEAKEMIDPKSHITGFWAPFLLLHLGGPDTVTAYALADNELWLRQLARLCIQVGLAGYIYSMALSGSALSILAAGMILVGFIKYAERTLCLYLASKRPLRDSMLSRPDFGTIYSRKMDLFRLKKAEGYQVGIHVITQVPTPEDLSVNSGQNTLVKAYEFFKIFKRLFVGLTVNFVDLDVSKRMFMSLDMDWVKASKIVEIELGFMYDLLFTKAPLLNRAWGIIRWVISLSVPCGGLVFFSLQDKKDYHKVDICITFLLISAAILLEIYSFLLAISSDWIHHWRLQRPRRSIISSAMALLRFTPSPRWSNSVAQFSLLGSSIRKRTRVFRHLRFAKLHEVVEKNFYIRYQKLDDDLKKLIFCSMKEMAMHLERTIGLKTGLASLKLETRELLKKSNCDHLTWSVEAMEFDQSILIWHIATELCHYKKCPEMLEKSSEDVSNFKLSMLVSRYMLYLLVFYPSMLPTEIGVLRYEDTLVEAQKVFEARKVFGPKPANLSSDEGSNISSVVINWARKLFERKEHIHTSSNDCDKSHVSRESRDLCDLYDLLLRERTGLHERKMRSGISMSVLFDACHLANQLKSVDTWYIISMVWVRMLIYAACQCKGYEHCESLTRGGELLSHVWLLMAHLGITHPVQTSEAPCITKLIMK